MLYALLDMDIVHAAWNFLRPKIICRFPNEFKIPFFPIENLFDSIYFQLKMIKIQGY